jgi:phosphopantothenoylcysteine decarboxylase/phosphopantothenate--cysteine ligase
LILVAPCTANTIGKISSGICDEPVSTLICTALGSGIPILIAAAMHEPMLKNPIIQEAKQKLEKFGVKFIEGRLVESKSKLAEPEEIAATVISEIGKSERGNQNSENFFQLKQKIDGRDEKLANFGLIITAGPTREPIDRVRFITNASSGKMGIALAEKALFRGAKRVCLIHGPGVIVPDTLRDENGRVLINSVATSQEMLDSVLSLLSKGDDYNILISAGAPADYTNLSAQSGKISTSEKPVISIELTATKKIISVAKEKFPKTFVVAFKAEYDLGNSKKLYHKAQELIKASNADIVVANDIGRTDIGFGSDFNEVLVVTKDGREKKLPKARKSEIAASILDIIVEEIRHHSN